MASNLTAGWFIDRSGVDTLYLFCGAGLLLLGGFAWWILPAMSRREETFSKAVLPEDSVA